MISSAVPKVRIQYERYVPIILFIWGYSWFFPSIGLYYYVKFSVYPNLPSLLQFSLVIIDLRLIAIWIFTPIIIILFFFIRLMILILFSRWVIRFCNWRSPQTELVAAAGVNRAEVRALNYYHLRGLILRILKWEVSKSIYPWLVPWAFAFVGANKIGKNSVLEDQFYTQEFLEMGENAYIGQGAIVSSHLVEGKYGAITLKKVKIGDHAVVGAFNAIPPGTELDPYTEFLPMSGVVKFRRVKGFGKYFGLPVGKISLKRYIRMLEIPDELEPLVLQNKQRKKRYKEAKNTQK
ncbi:MAG: hypothetical protein DRO88_10310 [Promethearchaeia archaeon]|nr:MAG: hypothetical protein DRO88_10310 [Candidatus Lokiarchaeia archaeon]